MESITVTSMESYVQSIQYIFPELTATTTIAFGLIFVVLIVASIVVRIIQCASKRNDTELVKRVNSWWIMVLLLFVTFARDYRISIWFFAFVSFLALKEFFSLVPTRRADRRILFWAYVTVIVQYYLIHVQWYGLFIVAIPVYSFFFIPLRMIMIGETRDFVRSIGTIQWGLMITVFSLSHVAYLLVLYPGININGGRIGNSLFLIGLTEINDVFQFIWGKSLGKSKIVPKVSPKKTWAGFLGGVVSTTCLSVILAPFLTPMTFQLSIFAGLIISIGGFVGDVIFSMLKRDLGYKDSGSLIPGHGGILDRLDSLCATAPLFLHFIRYSAYNYCWITLDQKQNH